MMDLVRHIIPALRQMTGKAYPALERDLSHLPLDTQHDLLRLLRDLQSENQRVVNRARQGLPF